MNRRRFIQAALAAGTVIVVKPKLVLANKIPDEIQEIHKYMFDKGYMLIKTREIAHNPKYDGKYNLYAWEDVGETGDKINIRWFHKPQALGVLRQRYRWAVKFYGISYGPWGECNLENVKGVKRCLDHFRPDRLEHIGFRKMYTIMRKYCDDHKWTRGDGWLNVLMYNDGKIAAFWTPAGARYNRWSYWTYNYRDMVREVNRRLYRETLV